MEADTFQSPAPKVALEEQKHTVSGLRLGPLETAPFVPDLYISSVAGVVERTMLVGGGRIYAPLATGETHVFNITAFDPGKPDSTLPYKVCDLRAADGGLRQVLGISQGGGASIVLDTESKPNGGEPESKRDRYLVQTDYPGGFVRATLLGGRKVLLVSSYKVKYGDSFNAISVADLKPATAEVKADTLKAEVQVTGLWPAKSQDDQEVLLIAYRSGEDGFIGLVDSEGNWSQQKVAPNLYPLFVTGGAARGILAITRDGVVRGDIKTEAGQEPKIVFQKSRIPPNFCRVFPAGDDKLLLVGKEGTVSLVNPETGALTAQLVHNELQTALKKASPGSLIHTYEALPTGLNEWTIFVNVRDRNGTIQEGKSFRVSAR